MDRIVARAAARFSSLRKSQEAGFVPRIWLEDFVESGDVRAEILRRRLYERVARRAARRKGEKRGRRERFLAS